MVSNGYRVRNKLTGLFYAGQTQWNATGRRYFRKNATIGISQLERFYPHLKGHLEIVEPEETFMENPQTEERLELALRSLYQMLKTPLPSNIHQTYINGILADLGKELES